MSNTKAKSDATASKRGGVNAALDLPIASARPRKHLHHAVNPPGLLEGLATIRDAQKAIKASIRKGLGGDEADQAEPAASALEDLGDIDTAAPAAEGKKKIDPREIEALAKANPQYQKLQEKANVINAEIVRIGGVTPTALAALLTGIVKDSVVCACQHTLSNNAKSVKVADLIGGAPQTAAWPIIRSLPAIVDYTPEGEKARADELTEFNRLRHAYAAALKLHRDAKKEGKTSDAPIPDKPEPPREVHPAGTPDTDFDTYIDNTIKEVRAESAAAAASKEDDAYAKLRVSARFRTVMSNLIIQLIHRLGASARRTVRVMTDTRTLNVKLFVSIVQDKFDFNGGPGYEKAAPLFAFIKEKVGIFNAWQENDKVRKNIAKMKKLEQMPAAEKQALLEKQAAAENAKNHEKAKKAREAALKAKARFEEAKALVTGN